MFKPFVPSTDVATGVTKIKTAISSTLPATNLRAAPTKGDSIQFPSGYARGAGECSSSFFTLVTSSQILDVAWGFRTGALSDSDSMFYNTEKTWGGSSGGFTTKGLQGFETASMVYSSTADYLNDGQAFQLDGDNIDLLGILNFKRSSYREAIAPGSFVLTTRASGASFTDVTNYTYADSNDVTDTIVGGFTNIKSNDGTIVGGVYLDYGIAIFDIFKLFFTSSNLRKISADATTTPKSPGRSRVLAHLTGTVANNVAPVVKHGLAFFSGSLNNSLKAKRTRYTGQSAAGQMSQMLNLYSGSYSQSLNSLCMDLCGVSAQSDVDFQSSLYFCRADRTQFNYSANPTFSTGSGENLTWHSEEPTTYVTSVGLFSDEGECLAIGKLSQPLKKDFSSEMNLRVRLDF